MHFKEKQISDYERALIRKTIKRQLVNEGILDSILSSVAGSGMAKLLPDTIVVSIKKKLLSSFLKSLGINTQHPLHQFIQNIIVNITLEDLSKIVKSAQDPSSPDAIKCDEVGEIILKACTQTLTNVGLKKLAVPIVHFFSENSFDSNSPNFIKKNPKFKSVSSRDVDAMLDSMIGIFGETLLSKIVFTLIQDHVMPIMRDNICKDLLGMDVSDLPPGPAPAPAPGPTPGPTPAPAPPPAPPTVGRVSSPSSGTITEGRYSINSKNPRYRMTGKFSENELYLIREFYFRVLK